MTEAEWLACTDPKPMIRFLELERMGTCRKLRLFGVALLLCLRARLSGARAPADDPTADS